jgi:hypothetical protein
MRKHFIGISAVAVCLAAGLYAPQGEVQAQPQVRPEQVVAPVVPVQVTVPDEPVAPAEPIAPLVRFELEPAAGISPEVLRLALGAVQCATTRGDIDAPPTLTIIDYSRPSVEPRLWVFDMKRRELLFNELVAHGRNTGENMSVHFSDTLNSRQSSIGLFVTDETYVGSNGYSLRLDGLEPGFNSHARERAIVMHGAPYVNTEIAKTQGRIGRSWGCPALREAVARDVIDTIRGGGVIFSYYPDTDWLKSSKYLNGCGGITT